MVTVLVFLVTSYFFSVPMVFAVSCLSLISQQFRLFYFFLNYKFLPRLDEPFVDDFSNFLVAKIFWCKTYNSKVFH